MESHRLFCPACQREVNLVVTDEPAHDGHASLVDSEVVCLEVGDECVGPLCPLGATGPEGMIARIVRNGLPLDGLHTLRARCPSCERETEMALYGNGRAACTECGSAARWRLDHAEPLE